LTRGGPASPGAGVHTDPPYGVSYEAQSGKFAEIAGDGKRNDELVALLRAAFQNMAARTLDDAAWYIWHASTTREDFAYAMKEAGLLERQYLVWVKPAAVLGRSDYRWGHEPCFYASKDGHTPAFYGDRTNETVWRVAARTKDGPAGIVGQGTYLQTGQGDGIFLTARPPKGKKARSYRLNLGETMTLATTSAAGTVWEISRDHAAAHPTQKPVELPRRAILNSTKPGQVVLDAFLGSGSTLIAAELTGRRCFGTELDPKYAAVTLDRWARTTEKTPTLDLEAPATRRRSKRGN
jgi:DNA modification methylase